MVFGLNEIALLFQLRNAFIDNSFLYPTITLSSLASCLLLQEGQIRTLTIDENFLAMFKVGLLKVGTRTNVMEGCIIVVDTTMKAMSIFVTGKQVLLDAFGAGACVTVFTSGFLANNRRETVRTDTTRLGFDDLVLQWFGFGSHGVIFVSRKNRINFYSMAPFFTTSDFKRLSDSV